MRPPLAAALSGGLLVATGAARDPRVLTQAVEPTGFFVKELRHPSTNALNGLALAVNQGRRSYRRHRPLPQEGQAHWWAGEERER